MMRTDQPQVQPQTCIGDTPAQSSLYILNQPSHLLGFERVGRTQCLEPFVVEE